jgi:methylated-DNA-protein-cysteine methyltransferase-like protein
MTKQSGFYEQVWAWVREIPKGKVATYGQVATALGTPRAARAVGYAMYSVCDEEIPWHRVINAQGQISLGGQLARPELQRQLLVQEGVQFDRQGRIELKAYQWWPESL